LRNFFGVWSKRTPKETMKRKKERNYKISENLCSIRNDTNCPLRETLAVNKIQPFFFKIALVAEISFLTSRIKRNEKMKKKNEPIDEHKTRRHKRKKKYKATT
jgi:hypothetical protein